MSRRWGWWAAVVAALAAGCGDQEPGAFAPRGPDSRDLMVLFWVMTVAGGLIFVGVLVALVMSARGRRPGEGDDQVDRRSARLVVGGGILLPIVVLVPLTIGMLVVGNRISPRLDDAYEIRVRGHLFWWEVAYPEAGAVTANEIHVPTGTRVRLVMDTADVIHSVWVPQLAGKIDMIPGQETALTFTAEEPGVFLGQCAEFCGIQHARMRFLLVAHEPAAFEEWLANEASPAREPATEAAERGEATFVEVGCAACHQVRGTEAVGVVGPDLTHIASRRTLGAGILPNTRGQLGGWIADPQAVKPGNLMPPTPLTSQQLLDLLEYLEGLE